MTDRTEYEIKRGERAQQLLQDELLTDALATIELEYTEQWKNSPARDEAGREKLWLMVKTVHRFKAELTNTMETGQIAKATLAQKVGQLLSRSS